MNDDQTPHTPTDEIFEYARILTRSLDHLLEPIDGHDWLSDDACDDLDSIIDSLDACSRALRADNRNAACELLTVSFRRDDPEMLHYAMPNTFDPINFRHWSYLAADCPRFCDYPDAD